MSGIDCLTAEGMVSKYIRHTLSTDELEEFPQSTYLQWAICAAIGADPAELLEEAMKEEHNP